LDSHLEGQALILGVHQTGSTPGDVVDLDTSLDKQLFDVAIRQAEA
jgi:hypothetical protein